MGYWDTDFRPTSKRALCNVLEELIRSAGGLFKSYYLRRFRRYVEEGMTPGAAASKAAPAVKSVALALQERALGRGRELPFPLTDDEQRAIETLSHKVLAETDRLKRES